MSEVSDLATQITAFGAEHTTKMTDLQNAKTAANTAADNIYNTTKVQSIHVHPDPAIGDDANDGLTEATPVHSWAKVTSIFKAGHDITVFVYGNWDIDKSILQRDTPNKVTFKSAIAGGGVAPIYKMNFVDATDSANRPGGYRNKAPCRLEFYRVDPVLNSSRSFGPLEPLAFLQVDLVQCTLSRIGAGAAKFIVRYPFRGPLAITQSNFVLDPSAEGYFVDGIVAGADPSADPLIMSSITSG